LGDSDQTLAGRMDKPAKAELVFRKSRLFIGCIIIFQVITTQKEIRSDLIGLH
jgi:hypothetical protein